MPSLICHNTVKLENKECWLIRIYRLISLFTNIFQAYLTNVGYYELGLNEFDKKKKTQTHYQFSPNNHAYSVKACYSELFE